MKKLISYMFISVVFALTWQGQADAQTYRSETRKGNKEFMKKGDYDAAVGHYKNALVADSLNIPALYNMAYVLHSDRRDSTMNVAKDTTALNYLNKMTEKVAGTGYEFDTYFNKGVICIDMKDWQGAVDAFKKCLLLRPGDMKALENYVYAKEHLPEQEQNQQNPQPDQQQQDQQQNQQQDGDQKQDQPKDDQQQDKQKGDQQQDKQNGDQQQDDQQQNEDQQNGEQTQDDSRISDQTAKQILQAIQDKEKDTQDKVNKKKAAMMQSKQKQKNW